MDTEIREAVRIIIDRYRTHPEEFEEGYGSKFGWVFGSGLRLKGEDFTDVFNEAEKAAVDKIYKDYKYRLFHARVMQALLGDTQYEARVEAQGKITSLPGGWVNASIGAQGINSLTNINQAQITHSLDMEIQKVKQQLMQVQGNSLKPAK